MSRMKIWGMQISENIGQGGEINPAVIKEYERDLEERRNMRGVTCCRACRGLGTPNFRKPNLICAVCNGSGEVPLQMNLEQSS